MKHKKGRKLMITTLKQAEERIALCYDSIKDKN